MSPNMKSVYSSNVDSIGYDSETSELYVVWRSSQKTSIYSGVPLDVAVETMNAFSVGQAIRLNIKGVYEHRYA